MDQIIKHGVQMTASLDPASQKELRTTLETIFSEAGNKLDFNTPQNRANIQNLAKAFQSIFAKAGNTSIDFSKIMQMPSDKMFKELGAIAATQFWDAWNAVAGGAGARGGRIDFSAQFDQLIKQRNDLMRKQESLEKKNRIKTEEASKLDKSYSELINDTYNQPKTLSDTSNLAAHAKEALAAFREAEGVLIELDDQNKVNATSLNKWLSAAKELSLVYNTINKMSDSQRDSLMSQMGRGDKSFFTGSGFDKSLEFGGDILENFIDQKGVGDSLNTVNQQLAQVNAQITQLTSQHPELIDRQKADEAEEAINRVAEAYERLHVKSGANKGSLSARGIKDIESALNYKPKSTGNYTITDDMDSVKINKIGAQEQKAYQQLDALANQYVNSEGSAWEKRAQHLLKFIREYEAQINNPTMSQDMTKAWSGLYQELKPMEAMTQNMLQNVLNMANNMPAVDMSVSEEDGRNAAVNAQNEAEADARSRAESDAKVKSDIKSAEASKQAAVAAEQERAAKEASAQATEKQAQLNSKIGYHYGNLFGGKSGARDTFGQTLDNLTIDAQPGSPSSYGYGVLGGGLFYVDDPNLFGDQAPSKGSKFISGIDFSKYNLYLANTEERVANLASLMSSLQRFAVKQAVPAYTGFDQQLSGVSIDTLWQQMQIVFENVNMTKQEFNQFIQEMIRLLQSSGAYLEKETGELAFNNIPDTVDNSDNMSTRLFKRLGYQGVSTAGTSFNGMDQGSVLFDFQNDDIVAFFDKLDAAIQHYNKTLTESDPSKITNSLEIVKEIDAIIERINAHKSIMTEATGGKFDTSGYDTTLKELEARRAMLVASDENVGKTQQEAVAHNNNSGAIKEETAAQEQLNQAEAKNPPAQEEAGVHNANTEAINEEANAQERLNVADGKNMPAQSDSGIHNENASAIQNETAATTQQIQSYEQLCQVVEKYNQLVAQGGIKSPVDMDVYEGVADSLDGVVPEDQLNKFNTSLDVNTLAQQLGIEIPQAANTAQQAVEGLNSSLEKKNAIEQADGGAEAAETNAETEAIQQQNNALQTNINLKTQSDAPDGASDVAEENAETEAIQQQNAALQQNINLKKQTNTQTGTTTGSGEVQGGAVTDGGVDVAAEATQLTNLQNVLAAVTTAVGAKTQAFTAEEAEVKRVVASEIGSLNELEQKVLSIKGTLEGLLANLKIGQTDIGAGLGNITVTVNKTDGADTEQKGSWALDTTVQSVRTSLDGVRTDLSNVISAIGNINTQPSDTNPGAVLATEATLGSVKAVLDAINGKIVAGTKGGSGKQSGGKTDNPSEKKTETPNKKSDNTDNGKKDGTGQTKRIEALRKEIGALQGEANNVTNELVRKALEDEIALRERIIQLIQEGSAMSSQEEARQTKDLSEKTKAAKAAAKEEEKAQKKAAADQQNAKKKAYDDFVKESKKKAGLSEASSTINKTRGTLTDAALIDNKTPEATAKVQQLHAALEQLNEKYKQIRASGDIIKDEDQQELIAQRENVQRLQGAVAQLVNEHQKLNGANAQKIGTTSLGLGASSEAQQKAITDAVMVATKGRAAIKGFNADTNELTYSLKTGTNQFTTFKAAIDRTNGSIMTVRGNTTQAAGVFETLGRKIKEYSYYFTGSMMIYRAIAWVREGITAIKDIDSALTELKKVTDATEESYEKFLDTAAKTADKVGSTIKEVVSSTADWARLGYSMKEAAELAESTQILMNVSEFTDISQATDSLISSIQAFKYTAEESMDVVDILNTIGKIIAYR